MADNQDYSLEEKIIDELKLSQLERKGAVKFMKAIKPFNGVTELINQSLDGGEDMLPTFNNTNLSEQQQNALIGMVSEYLNSFIITGYDMAGNRFCSWSFTSDMAVDGMLAQIQDVAKQCDSMAHQGYEIMSRGGVDDGDDGDDGDVFYDE